MRFFYYLAAALLAVAIFNIRPLMSAAPNIPEPWNATFDANPIPTDDLSEGDDHMRSIKQETRGRMETEHLFGTNDGSNDDGRHRRGSARIFWQNTSPQALGDPDVGAEGDDSGITDYFNSNNGSADDDLDQGRVWRDADDGYLFCNSSTDPPVWTQCVEGINANIHIDGTVEFLLDGDAAHNIEIHDHGQRHTDMTTAGAEGEEFDYVPNIMQDPDLQATAGPVTFTDCGSGAPGQVLDSVTLNATGRRGTSHALLIGGASFNHDASPAFDTMSIFLCEGTCVGANPPAGEIANTRKEVTVNASDQTVSLTVFHHITGITTASHTYDMVGICTAPGLTGTFSDVQLMVIDLGLE